MGERRRSQTPRAIVPPSGRSGTPNRRPLAGAKLDPNRARGMPQR